MNYHDEPLGERVAAEEQVSPLRRTVRAVLPTVRFTLLCAAIFFGLRTAAPTYAIDGESMSPTFHTGNRVILNGAYRFGSPERGDIVVFQPPYQAEEPYIKRVIGLPGDQISIHGGTVFLNGVVLAEGYISDDPTGCFHILWCDLIVPEGQVYVLGDNRGNSSDSRVFGPVDIDRIIGGVMVSIWPPDDIKTP